MPRPRRRITYIVYPKDVMGIWWVTALRRWAHNDELYMQDLDVCTYAKAKTARSAFDIARRCPAKAVVVSSFVPRKSRKWPGGVVKTFICSGGLK